MVGFSALRSGTLPEQEALLKRRNVSLSPLNAPGTLDIWRILTWFWPPAATFVCSILLLTASDFRFKSETVLLLLYYAQLILLLALPAYQFAQVIRKIGQALLMSPVRKSGLVVSVWWPFWRLFVFLLAAALSAWIGEFLWVNHFRPHIQLRRLQAYAEVDARTTTGTRLQDAGVVAFNATASVDRTRVGCLKNGPTYCVAPIVYGGDATLATPTDGGNERPTDLFMTGVDCCECPGEFRCGDWNVPVSLGGLRVFKGRQHDYFTLAVQEWATTHRKRVEHPVFFEWVSDPVTAYNELHDRGRRLKLAALVAFLPALLLVIALLNLILQVLCRVGLAVPTGSLSDVPGIGRAFAAKFHQQASQEHGSVKDPKYIIL